MFLLILNNCNNLARFNIVRIGKCYFFKTSGGISPHRTEKGRYTFVNTKEVP